MTGLERKRREEAQKKVVTVKHKMKTHRLKAHAQARTHRVPGLATTTAAATTTASCSFGETQQRVIVPSSTVVSPSFQRLQLNAYTVEIMQLEVQQLLQHRGGYHGGTVTRLGQVWQTLRTSRDLARIYSVTFDTDVWKSHSIMYERRYALQTMWEKVHETLQYRFQEEIKDWEQLRLVLEPFFIFEQPPQPAHKQPLQPSIHDEYLQKLHSIHDHYQPPVHNGEEAWQRVAAHQSSYSRNENDDPTDKVDRMMLDTMRQMKEIRLQRLQTPALKTAIDRLEQQERQDEAVRKASQLLRPFSANEQAQIQQALANGNPGEIVCQLETDIVTRQNMQTLRPGCVSADRDVKKN
jgi:hypothetical protein